MNSDRMTLTADTPNAISKTTGNEMSASCLATAYIVPHKMKALMIVPSMGIDYYRDCRTPPDETMFFTSNAMNLSQISRKLPSDHPILRQIQAIFGPT